MFDSIVTPSEFIPDAHGDERERLLAEVVDAFASLRQQNGRLVADLAAEHGVTASDYRVLFYIGAHAELTAKQLAEHLGFSTGAMTSLVDRLEQAGLARRLPHPTDRRSHLLELTEEGTAVVNEGGALYIEAFREALDGTELTELRDVFLALARAMGERATGDVSVE